MNPEQIKILVVVPVYNHGATLRRVVQGVLSQHPDVLVVNDGSTDHGLESISDLPVHARSHEQNRGKGAAVKTAARAALTLGATHIITIDADGQHDPADLPKFFKAIKANPLSVIVGFRNFDTANVPGSSRFGRSFSNFWLRVQTGKKIGDTQSGFRAYPVALFSHLKLTEKRYSFEVEVLVRSAWAGLELKEVPISVYYPAREKRISHFRAFADNVRISWLNVRLTLRAIFPWPHRRIIERQEGFSAITVIHPLRSLKILLREQATPAGLAGAAFVGVFVGTLPLIGLHTIAVLFAAGYLGWNRVAAVAASQLCMPPFVPGLCIEVGHYLRHGNWLTELSVQTLGYEALERIWEWALGSLLVAPVLAGLVAGVTFCTSWIIGKQISLFDKNVS